MRASVDYSVTQAHWLSHGDVSDLAERARRHDSAGGRGSARRHDVVRDRHPRNRDARVPPLQDQHGFSRTNTVLQRPGLDARFDVQVNQALPFAFAGTRWEILVGLRNLFRDPSDPASVYDELLVVRPPKRVVGGFLVRF